MNLVCLILWSVLGGFSVYHLIKNEPVHPLLYFCAVLVCIVLYAEKVLLGI